MFLLASANKTLSAQATFGITTWAEQSAVPFLSVNGVLQSRDGFLWMASDSGIVRFDGLHFRLFSRTNSGLLSNAVTAIDEDRDGNIVAGFESGGICVLRMSAASCESVDQGFPRGSVRGIKTDSHGALWIALRGGGLVRRQGAAQRVYGIADGLSTLNLSTVYVDRHDSVWAGTYDGGLVHVAGSSLSVIREPDLPSDLVWAIAEGADGDLWVATRKGLCQFHAGSLTSPRRFGVPEGLPNGDITQIHIDAAKRIWVASNHGGISVKDGPTFRNYSIADGLADTTVLSITSDSEGDIWAGTAGGLSRLRAQSFRSLNGPDGFNHAGVRIVFEDLKGNGWFGLSAGGVQSMRLPDDRSLSFVHRADNCVPLAGLTAQNGSIWLGCSGGTALNLQASGAVKRFPFTTSGHVAEINAFAEIADHRIFAATFGDGVAEYRDGRWISRAALPEVQNVNAVLAARDGLWVATYDHGLYCIAADGGIESFARQLSSAIPTNLNLDSDGSVWVETDHGLAHASAGSARMISFADTPLTDATVYNVVDDRHGHYWISSSLGIARVAREALLTQQLRPGTMRIYTAADGVRGVNYQGYAQPSAMLGSDGRVYFATSKGVSVVDPRLTPDEVPAITVRVDDLSIDGQRQAEARNSLTAPAGSRQVDFSYRATVLGSADRVRYRYRLDGYDRDWVYAGEGATAIYRGLAPGAYTFEVQGTLVDGLWSNPVTQVRLIKQAHLYQKWWFLCALAICAALLFRLLYLRKIQLVREAEARVQSAILHERELAAQQQTLELTQMNESLRSNLSRLSDGSDLQTVMEQVLASAVQQLQGASACIFLVDEHANQLDRRYEMIAPATGNLEGDPAVIFDCPKTISCDKVPVWRKHLDTRQMVLLDMRRAADAAMLWKEAVDWHNTYGQPVVLSVPLSVGTRVIGMLGINFSAQRGERLSKEQTDLANSLASLAAMALETNRLSIQAREAAIAEERTRLSEEMHDGIQQIFTAIAMQVAAATNRAQRMDPPATLTKELERIAETAERGIQEIRRSIRALHDAATLNSGEFLHQLTLLCASMSAADLTCSFQAPHELDLPASTRLNDLYRIAQEAVVNANKHARATKIDVALEKMPTGFLLSVADDGCGLKNKAASGGFGLRNMEERAKRLRTKLSIDSVPGRTVVSVAVLYADLR